jgi:hypothetical protein
MFSNKHMSKLFNSLLIAAGLIITAPYSASVLQFLEESFHPVIINQEVINLERDGNNITFSMRIYKGRQCRIISAAWVAREGRRLVPIQVFNSVGRPAAGSPYVVPGYSELGPYTTTLPDDISNADEIFANVYYECHFGYLTRQEFARVQLK